MRGFLEVFRLELTSLVRSKALAMLAAASAAWMVVLPRIATGDGTVEGARELYVRYSLGGVFALVAVSLLASATGALARERAQKRLALTLVRPVRYGAIVLAKGCALTFAGAAVMALACALLPLAGPLDGSRACRHVLSPVLPSVREEARAQYEAYMAHPDTPEAVRRANRETVLRLLEGKAAERYETVRTNAVASWRFAVPADAGKELSVRMRFSGQMASRQDLIGTFRLGGYGSVVSNMTQAVLEIPLRATGDGRAAQELTFENRGKAAVMLRPRRDIELLYPADGFAFNLVRAYVEMVSVLALLVAFGLLLSASLSRPVALFVAMVALLVGEMSPGVVSQCSEELDATTSDRIGLALARITAEVTRPVSALDPISRLSQDTCIEGSEVVRVVAIDLVLVPLLLAALSGVILPRKEEGA